jgi:ATP-dependent RNA helicase RhlE
VTSIPTFAELGVIEPICRALATEGYERPTPIQHQAIPYLLEGRDLLGIAQTGTGKTAAFALPILQRLAKTNVRPAPRTARALILTPTRELASQIGDNFRAYGRHLHLRHTLVFGGVGQRPQVDALTRGVDILIATPGRLLDLINQRCLRLDSLEILVLDEADRMFDMGFIRDVRKIVAMANKTDRQSLCFSATMPNDVEKLVREVLVNPARVEVTPQATTVERIDQRIYYVDAGNKRSLLSEVLKEKALARVIVFTRTKHGANKVAEHLERSGVTADAIHGNKSQSARQRALDDFKRGKVRVLVATDIAARGIDVDGITHVVNFELPEVAESYVHRIGRTARAGAEGAALSFCAADERHLLRDIEKTIGQSIPVIEAHPFHVALASRPMGPRPALNRGGNRNGGGHRDGGHRDGGHRDGGHRQGGGYRSEGHRSEGPRQDRRPEGARSEHRPEHRAEGPRPERRPEGARSEHRPEHRAEGPRPERRPEGPRSEHRPEHRAEGHRSEGHRSEAGAARPHGNGNGRGRNNNQNRSNGNGHGPNRGPRPAQSHGGSENRGPAQARPAR